MAENLFKFVHLLSTICPQGFWDILFNLAGTSAPDHAAMMPIVHHFSRNGSIWMPQLWGAIPGGQCQLYMLLVDILKYLTLGLTGDYIMKHNIRA